MDNSFENIGLGTPSENMMDIPKDKRILNASNPKYNHVSILKDREKGLTYKEIMLKHNISSKGTVSYVIRQSLKANENRGQTT